MKTSRFLDPFDWKHATSFRPPYRVHAQAAAVQALGFIAERSQPSQDNDLVALTICELLLPFTLEPQVRGLSAVLSTQYLVLRPLQRYSCNGTAVEGVFTRAL